MTGICEDQTYDQHLVFRISWEQPTRPEVRKILHQMGFAPRGFTLIGKNTIVDELDVLELGPHVEMEFAMQSLAIAGEHWADLGQYLAMLIEHANEQANDQDDP